MDVFTARPSHFLVKPVRRIKLKEALDKVIVEIEEERGNQIALCTSEEVIKVNPAVLFLPWEGCICQKVEREEKGRYYGKNKSIV